MKRPYEAIKEIFFENLDKLKENQRFNFTNSDKYMVWLVGFSIAGMTLIVANITQFRQTFNHGIIKAILILLSTSIVSGIVYRWAFYLWQTQYQAIEFYLQGAFSDKEFMEIEPDDLTEENDIKEVIRRIKVDFGEDVSHVQALYDQGNDLAKDYLLNDLKNHYKRTGEWAKKDYDLAIEYVKEVYQKAFGLSEKKVAQIFNTNTSKKLKFYGWITTIAFFLSCLSFIAVLIIVCISL